MCGTLNFCRCYKTRILPKINQEQIENYNNCWKIITERIEWGWKNGGLAMANDYSEHLKILVTV